MLVPCSNWDCERSTAGQDMGETGEGDLLHSGIVWGGVHREKLSFRVIVALDVYSAEADRANQAEPFNNVATSLTLVGRRKASLVLGVW